MWLNCDYSHYSALDVYDLQYNSGVCVLVYILLALEYCNGNGIGRPLRQSVVITDQISTMESLTHILPSHIADRKHLKHYSDCNHG